MKNKERQRSGCGQKQPRDDGAVFHYCSVQIPGIRRPYAYLTGGLPVKAGDWVEIPFGKNDEGKRVASCQAYWPKGENAESYFKNHKDG